ncbi:MAG: hypothetical protein IJR67_04990 [Acholeplasmatales bacterium]|nr:hypothetical protein [Acholeplasmatales bacterium]
MNIEIKELFDLNHTIAKNYLSQFKYPWEALKGIKDLIIELGSKLDKNEFNEAKPNVWIHKTAEVFESAYIGEYTIIGKNTEVRHSAFIRGAALIGDSVVIGNSVEVKNAIIFDNAEIPHFNYVGDSILGFHAHMGAGAITSNIKSDKKNIVIHNEGNDIKTDLRKIGAFLGDNVEVGCNSVLNPGTIVGRCTNIYPLSNVRGVISANSIYKNGILVKKIL